MVLCTSVLLPRPSIRQCKTRQASKVPVIAMASRFSENAFSDLTMLTTAEKVANCIHQDSLYARERGCEMH